ncbi:MAG: Type 1 glutamine amidotransferase-like domain-containing protein [Clostridia bacterium]|nr:Type 1 glutamine amidotransferase-like domain-containing protein [Clostridia bacterium]
MSRKIVAIGGGSNGRLREDGTRAPYETGPMDEEIIRLTGKDRPNFLLIAHSQLNPDNEIGYFNTMKDIYGDKFGCECKNITRADLINNFEEAVSVVDWADIIYEGGGDTMSMIKLWKETGFDEVLKSAYESGKVMCGVSAGANCWFESCSSDSLQIQRQDETAPLIEVDCLGFLEGFFTPHSDVATEHTNRLQHMKDTLEGRTRRGIALSNCCAMEIVDDKYRLIRSDASNYGIESYGILGYWKSGDYIEEKIDTSDEFKELSDLFPTLKAKKVVQANKDIFGDDRHNITMINAGFLNNVFDVDDKFIIKICDKVAESGFDTEAEFYEKNKENSHIPKLYKYDNSKTIINSVYEIIEKIEGKSLYYYWYKMTESEREETIKEIIDILKDVHMHTIEESEFDWGSTIKKKNIKLYEANKNKFSDEQKAIIEESFSKYDKYLEHSELAFIHNDIHFDNILKNDRGLFLIDFNEARVAAIDFEFRILYMCKDVPWKWANLEMDPYQKPEDYKYIDMYIKKYYPRFAKTEHIDERMIIYRILNDLYLLDKYDNKELIESIVEHSKKLIDTDK